MFISFQEIFNPTPEQKKKQCEFVNECIRRNLEEIGKDCENCKHGKYVQESPYYDYVTCEFDESDWTAGIVAISMSLWDF